MRWNCEARIKAWLQEESENGIKPGRVMWGVRRQSAGCFHSLKAPQAVFSDASQLRHQHLALGVLLAALTLNYEKAETAGLAFTLFVVTHGERGFKLNPTLVRASACLMCWSTASIISDPPARTAGGPCSSADLRMCHPLICPPASHPNPSPAEPALTGTGCTGASLTSAACWTGLDQTGSDQTPRWVSERGNESQHTKHLQLYVLWILVFFNWGNSLHSADRLSLSLLFQVQKQNVMCRCKSPLTERSSASHLIIKTSLIFTSPLGEQPQIWKRARCFCVFRPLCQLRLTLSTVTCVQELSC